MQCNTAERDKRYKKTEKRKVYGGEILEEDRLPNGPSKFSEALPCPATHLNYDSMSTKSFLRHNSKLDSCSKRWVLS